MASKRTGLMLSKAPALLKEVFLFQADGQSATFYSAPNGWASKEVLNYIKIDIIDASAGLTVLIDDSELVGDNWSLIAKKKNKDFLYFRSVDEFAAKAPKIPRSAAIYIDSDLGDGRRGEVAAKGIYEQGFLNISLTTGHLRSDFKECAWIRNVLGKRPPF